MEAARATGRVCISELHYKLSGTNASILLEMRTALRVFLHEPRFVGLAQLIDASAPDMDVLDFFKQLRAHCMFSFLFVSAPALVPLSQPLLMDQIR